jgi:hypothetical protein
VRLPLESEAAVCRKESLMPLIKPRTRGKEFVRLITRLEHETNETLYAYAQFLGEPVEYVLNQLIDTVLAKDKEFVTWRAEHPESCVPRTQPSKSVHQRSRAGAAKEGSAAAEHRSPVLSAVKSAG